MQTLHERSHENTRSERIDGEVKRVLRTRSAGAEVPHLEFERGSGRIETGAPTVTQAIITLTNDSCKRFEVLTDGPEGGCARSAFAT